MLERPIRRIIHHWNNLISDEWQPIVHTSWKITQAAVRIRKPPSVVIKILGGQNWGKEQGNDAVRISFPVIVLVKKWGVSRFFTRAVLAEASIPRHYTQLKFTWLLPDAELLLIVFALIQKVHTRSPSVCLIPASGPWPRRSRLGCLLWALGRSVSGPARCWFSSPILFGSPKKTIIFYRNSFLHYKTKTSNILFEIHVCIQHHVQLSKTYSGRTHIFHSICRSHMTLLLLHCYKALLQIQSCINLLHLVILLSE